MDSGWFAVDRNGRVAHFSTGEGGAMPHVRGFATGEAGGADSEKLLWEHLLPWMARQGFDALSMTTNGLLLDEQWSRVSRLGPDKIHLSIHFPHSEREVSRVIRQVSSFGGWACEPA